MKTKEEVIPLDEFIKSISAPQTAEETNIAKTIETVINRYFNHKDIREKTELSKEEILVISRLFIYHKILTAYNVNEKLIPHFLDNYLHLLISKNRQGRREIVEILSSFAEKQKEEEDNIALQKKLFERIK